MNTETKNEDLSINLLSVLLFNAVNTVNDLKSHIYMLQAELTQSQRMNSAIPLDVKRYMTLRNGDIDLAVIHVAGAGKDYKKALIGDELDAAIEKQRRFLLGCR